MLADAGRCRRWAEPLQTSCGYDRGMKVMLALASYALTGCVGQEHCDTYYESDESYDGGQVASGLELVAVTWYKTGASDTPFAALVSPTGMMSQPVQLPAGFASATLATTGHASAIWMKVDNNGQLTAAVADDHDVWSSLIASSVMGDSPRRVGLAFDGHVHHMFWLADARLQHEEVSEQGVFGAVDDLGPVVDDGFVELFVVTDGSGQIYVVLADSSTQVLSFDPATTTTRELSSRSDIGVNEAFWFAGELHLREDVYTDVLHSFDPATLHWRDQTMPAEVEGAAGVGPVLYASPTTLYAQTNEVYELDRDLVVTKLNLSLGDGVDGTLGPDWIGLATYANGHTTSPGFVGLEQGRAGTNDLAWGIVVARDSPVIVSTACGHEFPVP